MIKLEESNIINNFNKRNGGLIGDKIGRKIKN